MGGKHKMKKRNVFYTTIFAILLIFSLNAAVLANSNPEHNDIDHHFVSSEYLAQSGSDENGLLERGARDTLVQSTTLGVNVEKENSIPFFYNIIIGAIILVAVLFFFNRKSVK